MKQIILFLSFLIQTMAFAQQADTTTTLNQVTVIGYKTVNGVGHFLEQKDGIIYAGKKNEVILVADLDANKAINNTRQLLGRIPGLNIVETESSGFTANGIATRGLNPTQSIEMNTRQNGYNMSGDIYGYNEAYYLPPMEAVQRIEMLRGAASLQFGAQFGGLVNYVLKDAPKDKKITFSTDQTVGSFGLFNSFNSLGGTYKKVSYYGFLQYRTLEGYRPNSQQWQLSGFGKIQYNLSDKIKASVEYSALRNQIKMPGGLSDSLFHVTPQASTRTRNWLKSPWNTASASFDFNPSQKTTFSLKTTYLFSSRALVWRNEDGGSTALDLIDPTTNEFVPREVGKVKMNNTTTELRFSHQYNLGNQPSTIASGVRYSYAWFKRQGGGKGSTKSDFDLSITGNWGYDLDFTTTNVAPFIENIFKINDKLTITPGLRIEYLKNTIKGHKETDSEIQAVNESKIRKFPLFGIGTEYKITENTSGYANFSQAYRPIDYSQLEPFGISSKIDKNLKDAFGYNADLGYRGVIKNYLNFDVGLFYMQYNNRIGIIVQKDATTGVEYSLRTNIANSVHQGIETYVEFNVLKYLDQSSKYGLSIFDAFAYTDAKYVNGEYKGNRVEAAVKTINRIGIIFNTKQFSTALQFNQIGDAYGDATNTKTSDEPIAGYIPSYNVIDWSATYKYKQYALKFGINNATNQSYFTRRTDEYPGPGIIPSIGRSFYLGVSATF